MTSCRFCFEIFPSNIGSSLSDCEILLMLNVIKSDLTLNNEISKSHTVCPSCASLLKTTYNFKVLCMETETKLQNHSNHTMILEGDSSDLIRILERDKGIKISPDTQICRTCLQEVTGGEFLFANAKIVGVQHEIREMLNVCFSEMNLLLTKEPVICKNCVEMLIMSFAFHSKCAALQTDSCSRSQFKESRSTSSNQPIEGISSEESYDLEQVQSIDLIDTTSLIESEGNTKHLLAFSSKPNSETWSNPLMPQLILSEKKLRNEKTEVKTNISINTNHAENNGKVPADLLLVKKIVSVEDETEEEDCQIIIEDKEMMGSKPSTTGTKYYFCKTCTYRTKRKAFLLKHKVVHFPGYKKTTFKCKECGYTVKRQKYLDRHLSLHAKGIDFKKHKCNLCSFCTRKKSKLERHMTVHKDERDTVMYKCSKCNFITKWKEYLTQHELIHNASDIEKKFKCNECNFSTNWRGSLVQHKVVHVSEEEALKFHCMECSFKTKRKDNLTKHMIRHMKIEDVRIFYCPECSFTSKYSSKLSRHLHVHKKRDELTIHKCTECPFQTRWKNNLSQHMRVHQNASEFELFKCKDCSFTTKWKTCLTEHLVMHKTGDSSKEFKCQECNFTTKWKKSLNMHQLTHSADETIKKFKCDVCEYKTYRSHHLKRHMKVHSK